MVLGRGASEPSRRFTSIVCSARGWEEINFGVDGSPVTGRDSEGFLTNYDSGVARVPDVIFAQPNVVIVLHGETDFVNSVPLGDAEEFQPGTFRSEYDSMVRGLTSALGDERIVLSTLPWHEDGPQANEAIVALCEYNDVIRSVASRYSLRLLEPDKNASTTPVNIATLISHSIYLNDEGHERLAAFYIHELANIH